MKACRHEHVAKAVGTHAGLFVNNEENVEGKKAAQSLPLAMTPSVDRVTAVATKHQTAKLSDQ